MNELSPIKRALLERRLAGATLRHERGVSIPRRSDPEWAPLAPTQRPMWLLSQLAPGNPAYNLPQAFRLRGALDPTALERALGAVVERHAALRTTFVVREGEPWQRIHPSFALRVEHTALDRPPDGEDREIEVRLAELATQEAVRPFDLERLPLIRARLFRLGPTEHVLLLVVHHLVADGVSMGVLLAEIDAFYRAFVAGTEARLPPLALQYPDVAAWQRQRLDEESAWSGRIEFWRRELSGGDLPVLDLLTDRPRPSLQTFGGSNVLFDVPAELARDLAALGARERATPFMTLLTAFEVLLHRYTRAADLVIGTPLATREPRELEGLVGCLLDVTLLRCELSGDPTLPELLGRTRDRTLDAFSNALPLELLTRHLGFARDPSRNPLFQTMLQLSTAPPPRLGELEVAPFRFDLGFAQVDVALHLYEERGGYHARLEYCTALYERATAERIAASFELLLREIVRDPARRISEIPILPPAERERVLVEWNDTAVDVPSELLHEPFEAQVRATPDAVALELEGRELTYARLDERASSVAAALRARGVGPETLVGVLAERSFEMVTALLGVLKAGGAYVPLDPDYPRERLRHMLEDARPLVVLAQPHLADRLPHDVPVQPLDTKWGHSSLPGRPEMMNVPISSPTAQSLAYVIFTSGSTGRPKGAMNTHRGIANRLRWMQQAYRLGPEDRVLQKTPFSFDVSVWEFFWPLATGARLVIALPGGHMDSGYLVRTVRERAITTLHFVPSMLRVFLEEPDVASCRSLVRVIASGEALPRETQARFHELLPHAELHNLYGPTEAAVDVTHWRCSPTDERSSVPIGRPVANTRIHVLDARLEPVPVGVPGELFIGGVQVGRGYVARPDLTAERFPSDPFSGEQDARLYRTGDLARYLPDGAIEYLGRLDHQVKLRGQRIELGEIEAALDEHPEVRQSVVLVRGERLAAWIVARAGTGSAALVEHLSARLPQYMVPSELVFLDELPLTSSGKVDRKRLPDPTPAPAAAPVAPRTPTEAWVAQAFGEILHRERVGARDSFFELGGNSLDAARLMARLRARSGADLPLRVLFERPTVEALAEVIDAALPALAPESARPVVRAAQQQRAIVPLQPHGSRPPVFGIGGHNGDVFCYRALARELGEEQPFYGLEPPGLDEHGPPLARVEDQAAYFALQVRTFLAARSAETCIIAGYCAGGTIAFELARQLAQAGQPPSCLLLLGAPHPERYRSLPLALDFVERQLGRVRRHAPALAELPRLVRERRARNEAASSAIDAALLARRRRVERVTIVAVRRYTPAPYAGGVCLLLPSPEWADTRNAPLRWREVAAHVATSVGPPGCRGDNMLAEPHVAAIAKLVRAALDARCLP